MTTPAARAATGYRLDPEMGVQWHGMWSAYTDVQRLAILAKLQGANIRSVRLDVSWAMLQPTDGASYDPWGVNFLDRVLGMATDAGITTLITLWLTPGWANNHAGERTLPTDVGDYARVAEWAAQRWQGKVSGWEVWNEPNLPDMMVGTDPAAYTRLLRAAYPAFHSGNPSSTVVFGAPCYNDVAWVSRCYDAGAHGYFDVMATHPYMAISDLPPGTADDGTMWTLRHASAVHDLMVAKGDGAKPLWFTEFGWSTHANPAAAPNWARGVTEALQARYLTDTMALIRSTMPYVGKVFWYTERDSSAESPDHNQHYGLTREDTSSKPALGAARKASLPKVPPAAG